VNSAVRTQCAGQARTAIFKFAHTRGRADSINVVAVIRVIGPVIIRAASIGGLVAVIIEPAHTRSLQR
jgi:hypothetical protein